MKSHWRDQVGMHQLFSLRYFIFDLIRKFIPLYRTKFKERWQEILGRKKVSRYRTISMRTSALILRCVHTYWLMGLQPAFGFKNGNLIKTPFRKRLYSAADFVLHFLASYFFFLWKDFTFLYRQHSLTVTEKVLKPKSKRVISLTSH